MTLRARADFAPPPLQRLLQTIPRWLLAGVPLPLLQPFLGHIATHVARSRPELFARLGPHAGKLFLIDPIDLPFVLLLRPNAKRPQLTASGRLPRPRHDAAIAGTFLDLLGMLDGSLDGDALFFSRDLRVSGDTEAVVVLRNALDDLEGNALDSIISAFGPLSAPIKYFISSLRGMRTEKHDG
jgi:predicted lipid carrier protein YhbT